LNFILYDFVSCLLPTFSRYSGFGTKLSPIFGFAKSSKYKTNFPLSQLPKSVVACVGERLFCRNCEYPQSYNTFAFQVSTFQIPTFQISVDKFQLFKFLLINSNFHASAFQIPIFEFLLINSNFHASAL
jgi:hypothetical protein